MIKRTITISLTLILLATIVYATTTSSIYIDIGGVTPNNDLVNKNTVIDGVFSSRTTTANVTIPENTGNIKILPNGVFNVPTDDDITKAPVCLYYRVTVPGTYKIQTSLWFLDTETVLYLSVFGEPFEAITNPNAVDGSSRWVRFIEEKYLEVGDIYGFSVYPHNNAIAVNPSTTATQVSLKPSNLTINKNIEGDQLTVNLDMDTNDFIPDRQGYFFLYSEFLDTTDSVNPVNTISYVSGDILEDINDFGHTINYDNSSNKNFKLFLWDKDMRPYNEPVDLIN